MVNKPCCIDLYRGDDVSDSPTPLSGLDRVKKIGIFALIHKASEGTAERDSRYDARRGKWMSGGVIPVVDVDGAKLSLGLVWGAYHFFHGLDPAGEAKNFLFSARLLSYNMAFIDWEAVGASGYQPSIEAADTFCQVVEEALGRPCGVYGGNVPRERFNAGKASTAVLERFSKRPFWFAAYGGVKDLTLLPEPWKEVGAFLWQDDGDRSGPGPTTIPGIERYCDNSTVVSPMTFAKLHNAWVSGAAPAPKPVEVPPAPPPIAVAAPPSSQPGFFDELKSDVEKVAEDIANLEKGENKS